MQKEVKDHDFIPGADLGQAYSNFVDSIKTRATLSTYGFCLQKYLAFRKKTIHDDLLTDPPKIVEAHLKDFIMHLKGRGLSEGYIRNNLHAIKHFFDMNDLTLNWKKINKFIFVMEENPNSTNQQQRRKKDRSYTSEEIQRMLDIASHKTRTIILLLASTGMRLGAVPPLKLRHLSKIDQYDFPLYQITVYENTPDEYITFCTPEAAKTLDSYLDHRRRAGEKLTPDSAVFRTDFDPDDLFQVKNKSRSIGKVAIQAAIQLLLFRTGISPRHNLVEGERAGSIRKDVQLAHGFRKFANTQMVQSEMKGAAKEMLLGHSIGLDDKYYRPTPQQLLDEYLKAVDLLTINEEHRLRRKVADLTVKIDEMQELRNAIEELRASFAATAH